MNNMLFVFMKHLRDKGIAADLFLFNNEMEHFLPCNDTKYKDYKKYIKQLTWGSPESFFVKSKQNIIEDLDGYDIYIGSGFSPAFFKKAGLKLDFFAQYGSDLYEVPFKSFSLKPRDFLLWNIGRYQKKGILESKHIINEIISDYLTEPLKNLKRDYITLRRPLVHDIESFCDNHKIEKLIIETRKRTEFLIFSQARHLWKNVEFFYGVAESKGNDVLIRGFAKFSNVTLKKTKLVLVEYGPDVEESKKLIQELKIEQNIIWIPKTSRSCILKVIQYSDLIVDQFMIDTIGCSGWEAIASGKNLVGFIPKENYTVSEQENIPPMFHEKTINGVFELLSNFDEKRYDETYIQIWYKSFIERIMNEWLDIFQTYYKDNKC